MTFTTPPLGPRKAQRAVERADVRTRDFLRVCRALTEGHCLDFDGADSLHRRESRKMERAWGRVRERWEEMALKHAVNHWQRGMEIAQGCAAQAARRSEDWRAFGEAPR